MINTCTFAPDKASSKIGDHVASFQRLVDEAKELNPAFINSHSGRDSWSFEDACKFFTEILPIQVFTFFIINCLLFILLGEGWC